MVNVAQRITRNAILHVLDLFSRVLISFYMVPFVVHLLGDRLYGFWTLVGSFIGYYGLLDLGLSSAVEKYIANAIGKRDLDGCNLIINTALHIYFFIGLIIFLISVIISILSFRICKTPEDASILWKIMIILGVNSACDFPLRALIGVLTANLHHDILTTIRFFTMIIRTVLVIVFLSGGYKIIALSMITFLSTIPERCLIIYLTKKHFPAFHFKIGFWSKKIIRDLFSYSIFSFIAQISNTFKFYTDSFVVSAFMGLSLVTHYNIANEMANQFRSLIITVMSVFQPIFSKQNGENDKIAIDKTFSFATKVSIYCSSFIGLSIIALGKPFIQRWMGNNYLDAYPVLVILTVGSLFASWQNPSINLLYGLAKHHLYALFNSIEGIANLVLSLLLVRKYGLIGVALGTFIPIAIVKLTIQPIYVCNACSFDLKKYIKLVFKPITISFLTFIPLFYLCSEYATPNYLSILATGAIMVAWYTIVILLCGFSSQERILLIQTTLPKPLSVLFN